MRIYEWQWRDPLLKHGEVRSIGVVPTALLHEIPCNAHRVDDHSRGSEHLGEYEIPYTYISVVRRSLHGNMFVTYHILSAIQRTSSLDTREAADGYYL